MEGKCVKSIGLMKCDSNFQSSFQYIVFSHREHLAAKYFKYEDIIKTVLEIVNFKRVHGKNL